MRIAPRQCPLSPTSSTAHFQEMLHAARKVARHHPGLLRLFMLRPAPWRSPLPHLSQLQSHDNPPLHPCPPSPLIHVSRPASHLGWPLTSPHLTSPLPILAPQLISSLLPSTSNSEVSSRVAREAPPLTHSPGLFSRLAPGPPQQHPPSPYVHHLHLYLIRRKLRTHVVPGANLVECLRLISRQWRITSFSLRSVGPRRLR